MAFCQILSFSCQTFPKNNITDLTFFIVTIRAAWMLSQLTIRAKLDAFDNLTVPKMFSMTARRHRDKVMFHFESATWTFGQVRRPFFPFLESPSRVCSCPSQYLYFRRLFYALCVDFGTAD